MVKTGLGLYIHLVGVGMVWLEPSWINRQFRHAMLSNVESNVGWLQNCAADL